jgi:hypothetical protein
MTTAKTRWHECSGILIFVVMESGFAAEPVTGPATSGPDPSAALRNNGS